MDRRRQALAAIAALALAALAGALVAYLATRSGSGATTSSAPDRTVVQRTLPLDRGNGDPAAGKPLFARMGCGICHTLAAAGAHGTVGTNLDADPPSYDLLLDTVTNGVGRMPSFKARLSAKQIRDLAAYVVTVTH